MSKAGAMLLSVLLLLVSVLGLSAAADGIPKAAIKPRGWQRQGVAPRDGKIKLHLALKQEDGGAQVEQELMAISDPHRSSFRKFKSFEQMPLLSIPAQETVGAVELWLWQCGLLSHATLNHDMFEVDTTIRDAERLLNTTYFVYSDGQQEVIRTEQYYLPETVAGHLDFITPTNTFPPHLGSQDYHSSAINAAHEDKKAAQALGRRAGCGSNDYATPTCIRQAYDINHEAAPSRVTFAVYGTEAAEFSSTDLQIYLERYNPAAAKANPKYTVVGSGDPSEKSDFAAKFETALDTQTLMGLAWPAKGILYNNGGVFGPHPGQTYDRFVSFLQQLITDKTAPSVISFSESMAEDMVDPAYAKRLCNMMAQVGTRGITLLFSSGDNGPNGDQPSGAHKNIFEPEFPASCPWVTAVGGTTNLADETAATQSTISLINKLGYTASGGGFSNLFQVPLYQQSRVGNYTTKHIPSSYSSVSGFNAHGRGIPDVSGFSTSFPTVVDLVTFPVGGTSASTPLWAAVVTLLNDYEASRERPPLGFLNPWLYSLTSGLKDITTGGNNVGLCDILAGCHLPKTLGYNVTVGWDPVTGLGSPIFSQLIKALDNQAKL